MRDFLGFGEVAEWFKAAVLKTAPENIADPRFSAKPAEILTAASRVPHPFAKNNPARESAQWRIF